MADRRPTARAEYDGAPKGQVVTSTDGVSSPEDPR